MHKEKQAQVRPDDYLPDGIDRRLAEREAEEERQRQERKEKKKEAKKSTADGDADDDADGDMMALMGFGGFGGGKKN